MKQKNPKNAASKPSRRWTRWGLPVVAIAAIGAGVWSSIPKDSPPAPGAGVPVLPPLVTDGTRGIGNKEDGARLTTWDLLAMSDDALERMSLVEMNLIVARDMPGCEKLEIGPYEKQVNDWVADFKKELPGIDAMFKKSPEKWNNDLDFFRFGSVMNYMGARLGMVYDPELIKVAGGAKYTDPKSLFVYGLIRDKKGTCANMPVLQAAIARKLGFPVSLVSIGGHCFCRWDDGKKHLNIETTQTDKGGFSSDTDAAYAKRFNLSEADLKNRIELRTLTARQMLGLFIADRGRCHFDRQDYAKTTPRRIKITPLPVPSSRLTM